jgi:hypothetical protein
VRQNIGTVNALVRITCGFALLAWSTARMVKKPNQTSLMVIAIAAAMKIAEGFTRFCPLTYLFEENVMYEGDEDYYEDYSPLNPS